MFIDGTQSITAITGCELKPRNCPEWTVEERPLRLPWALPKAGGLCPGPGMVGWSAIVYSAVLGLFPLGNDFLRINSPGADYRVWAL